VRPPDLEGALATSDEALGLALPAGFARQIETYLDELDRWQRIGSLTAYEDRAARLRHLVLESLMLLAVLPAPASPLLDIGSGPGVPGLILKLARPDWDVVLIEATRRRANFLRHVARHLGVEGVDVHWGRAEVLTPGALDGRFRIVTMRAVAAGAAVRALALPYLAPDGALVVPLGPGGGTSGGTRRDVELPSERLGELPWRRQFHIISRAELETGVPRGTERAPRAQSRGREPEGRRREDHDCR
jgi:16S rRNA (guanine527-N7)-methyltransferase